MNQKENLDDLTYQWPSNLSEYEAKIFLGMTATEAMATSMAFLLPIGVMSSGFGFIIGAISALVVLLSIKKVERFGNQPLLIHAGQRIFERRRANQMELPLIIGGGSGRVEIENWEGETIMTLDDRE